MAFCDIFGDSSVARILDHLAKYENRDYSLTELARDCNVSYRTIQRVFPVLVQKQFVRMTRRVGKANMYSINLDNSIMKELHKLLVKGLASQENTSIENRGHHIAYV
jgi:DNA-binding transcriptional regulator YhcF (GntR family)